MILNGYMNANGAAHWVERVQGSASSGQPCEPVLQSLQEVACALQRHVCFHTKAFVGFWTTDGGVPSAKSYGHV
jgi:hypothetical protein